MAGLLHTRGGIQTLRIRCASDFFSRLLGLMLRGPLEPDQGLLLTRCSSVHSALMRYPIDLVYLDRQGSVVRCFRNLRPWRFSFGPRGSAHTLELSSGSIDRFDIQPGDRFEHPALSLPRPTALHRQSGSAMLEFAVVGPVITLIGMAVLQYTMLFFAKNQISHASFMAARAGSFDHANLTSVRSAYTQALVPLYGGGRNAAELAQALAKASADVAAQTRIELLNPTKESFDDWNDPALQNAIGKGKRVIANSNLAFKDLTQVKPNSGQNLSDANLIKLRITQGYAPKIPLMGTIYTKYLQWLDPKSDAFHTRLVTTGRIPVVTHVTLQMHSDPIEPDNPVSMPGPGNNGNPQNPGDPPVSTDPPPDCETAGCTVAPPNTPPPCDPATDANGCRPPGCSAGDFNCDPRCGTTMCCVPP